MKSTTLAAATLLSLLSVVSSTPLKHSKQARNGVQAIAYATINTTNSAVSPPVTNSYQVPFGTLFTDANTELVTSVSLAAVDVENLGVTVTPRNVSCVIYDNVYAVEKTWTFGGFAGAGFQQDSGYLGNILCLVTDGEGDCPV